MQADAKKPTALNPIEVLLWTFRRSESDVINLYDSLASVMQASTGGNMLNFGYWKDGSVGPLEAQAELCRVVAGLAELGSARRLLDVGSGFSEPAMLWRDDYPRLEISCLNVNKMQLSGAARLLGKSPPNSRLALGLVNSTATRLPFAKDSIDRIIALESAQHFRPLSAFLAESRRVLSGDGIMVIAMPVMARPVVFEILRLGILSFTWSSEHYALPDIEEEVRASGMTLVSSETIGRRVYEPLADYYMENRERLRPRILERYPQYVEGLLCKSLAKMSEVSRNSTIDYALLKISNEK